MNDSERKLVRILYNHFSKNRCMPGWTFLIRSTGKTKPQLIDTLDGLQVTGVLTWSEQEPTTIQLLQLPEQHKKAPAVSAERYYTEY